MDKVNKVADFAEAYYRLIKELNKTLPKEDFKLQEQLLAEQWWSDVCRYFGWEDINAYYKEKQC